METKCPNCKRTTKRRGLCDDCKADAAELTRKVQRPTDDEILATLERKPRSWRDVFFPVRSK